MSDPQVEKEAGPAEPVQEKTPEPEKKKREYKDFGEEEEKVTRTCFLFILSRRLVLKRVIPKMPRSTCLRLVRALLSAHLP